MKELRKVVANADVVLEVLDARDPMGRRCADIEDSVASNPLLLAGAQQDRSGAHDVLEDGHDTCARSFHAALQGQHAGGFLQPVGRAAARQRNRSAPRQWALNHLCRCSRTIAAAAVTRARARVAAAAASWARRRRHRLPQRGQEQPHQLASDACRRRICHAGVHALDAGGCARPQDPPAGLTGRGIRRR